MRSLIARAPTRLDFGGGWTDVPPYSTREGGRVCNVAIERFATAELFDAPIGAEVAADEGALARAALARARMANLCARTAADYPVGAGLGGSSALGVAMSAALHRWTSDAPFDRGALAEESRRIEVEDLGIAGGRQDHYAAAYGGALDLTFGATTEVTRIPLSPTIATTLEERVVLCYTGRSRLSGATVTAVLDAYERGEPEVVAALARMKALAGTMAEALARGDLDALGAAVGEHWHFQRSLHPTIPTTEIDAMLAAATRAGALGGKALGASGGGCVMAIAARGREVEVRAAMSALGAPLTFRIAHDGVLVDPHGAAA